MESTIMKICIIFLNFAGIDKEKWRISQVTVFFYSTLNGVFVMVLVSLLFVYKDSPIVMTDITNALSCILVILHGIAAWITTMFLTKAKILHLTKLMKENFWNMDCLEYQEDKQIFIDMHREIKNKTRFLLAIYQLALLGYLAPFLTKGQNLVFDCYRPQWLSYYFILFMEEYACIMTIFLPINVTDFLFLIFSTMTAYQFKLLAQRFNRIYNVSDDSLSQGRCIKAGLKECIEHHIFLLEFVKKLDAAFSIYMFLYLGDFLLCMCVEMFKFTTESDVTILFKCVAYILSGFVELMFCYCMPAQAVRDEAEKIANMIYASKWYNNINSSKEIIFVINKSQKQVNITGGGFVRLDLATGLLALKTTVSYYTFLKTIGITEKQ